MLASSPCHATYASVSPSLSQRRSRTSRDRKSTRLNSSHSQISYAVLRDLHSFPTRRSSDLGLPPERQTIIVALVGEILNIAETLDQCLAFACRRIDNFDAGFIAVPCHIRQCFTIVKPAQITYITRSEEHTSELQSQSNLVCRPPRSTLFPYTTLFRSRSATRTTNDYCGARR